MMRTPGAYYQLAHNMWVPELRGAVVEYVRDVHSVPVDICRAEVRTADGTLWLVTPYCLIRRVTL
jgi:hypothetical protein